MNHSRSNCFSLAAALLLLPSCVFATDHDVGSWLIVSLSDRMPSSDGTNRWRYWLETQARYSDFGSGSNQLLIRPGVGYDLNDRLVAWAGYGRFRTHPASGRTVTEDRYWQQLSWRFRDWELASLSIRLRLEERSLSTGDDLGVVLRGRILYERKSRASAKRRWVFSLEPFFDLRDTDWGASSGLSQIRSYAGVAWSLTDKSKLEVGYQNQFSLFDDADNRMRHLATLKFKTKF